MQEYVELPGNHPILNWSAQDTMERIMGMEQDDREGVGEIQQYLTQTTPEQRTRIGQMIARKSNGDRHLIEALVEGNVEAAFQNLLRLARGQE